MGKRFAKFRANEKRFRPSLTDDRSSSHICAICKFAALDGIGLQMHWLQSPYCGSVEPSLPASLLESDDEESHHSSQYNMDNDVGLFSSDNEHDDIHSPSAKVAQLASPSVLNSSSHW